MCLDYGVLSSLEDGGVSGLWHAASPGGWCVWIMVCCLARRMVCLDYGVLPRQEDGVSRLWRAATPGGWCVWIIACCLAWRMVCLDYGVLSRLEDGVSG